MRNNAKEDLLLSMPGAMEFVEDAMVGGSVLVHSLMEVRACTIACACCAYRGFLGGYVWTPSSILIIFSDEAT